MIITAFDPGSTTFYATFDSRHPDRIDIGKVEMIGQGRLSRPCPMHITELIAATEVAVVEEVGPMPAEGVRSVFTFGLALGSLLGSLHANNVPVELVAPKEWKKVAKLNKLEKSAAKEAARRFSIELWPHLRDQLRFKSSHGMAEAALMTRWYCEMGPGRDIPAAI